jgi:molybdenum cofactor biosynthesis enzyme MoaA
MPVALADQVAAEFAAMGGAEVFVTGGEPFLHPQIGELITAVAARLPVTILTNAMVVDRGRRRAALEALPRQRVTLQISLDSVSPAIHDRNRGPGSHAKAMAGIGLARELGFAVRLAATMYPQDAAAATGLTALLDDWGIPADHRLIRPVAQQGFATAGEAVTVDTLAPEPTVAVDGVWWHPVGVTDPGMLVSPTPLPLRDALDTISDTVRVQDAARAEGRRHVFRCA